MATPPTRPAAAPAVPAADGPDALHRLDVVDVSVRVIFHTVLLGSVYLLFAGHNQPGGGFVGGLVAGAAIALRFVAGGIDEVRRLPGCARGRSWAAACSTSTVTALVPRARRPGAEQRQVGTATCPSWAP